MAALVARTEGWAAGLQLAALSLRGQEDVASFVAAFTGSHRYVLDYLAEEVLERQGEQVRAFLLETSVLDRLSGELCDAVTGRTGSQALLEQVERAGLFLVPLDEVRGWWRYHHLFADLLRARLQAERPGQVAQLHRNAAGWYEEHGLADEAIRHAVAAGEMTSAARLIERHFDAAHSQRGEAATIQRWLAPLPAELVRSRPRLLLAQAVPAATSGHLEEAEQLIDAAELASAGTDADPLEPTIGKAGSLLVNVPALIAIARGYLAQLRLDGPGTAEFAARGMAEISDGEWILRSVAQGQLAVADWLGGRLAGAERAFTEGIAGRRAAGLPTWSAWESYELGRVQQAQGRLDAVVLTCEQALDAIARPGQAPLPAAGPAYVSLAEVAYQRNELDSALSQVTEGIALCRSFVYTVPLAAGLATLAWIRQATGDPAGALAAMGEAVRAAPGPPGLVNPSRRSGRGCSWPRATWAGRPAGRRSPASLRTMSRSSPGSRDSWCWPASCWRRAAPARRSRCWTGCTRRPAPRTAPAASSRSARCGRWRWPPAATSRPRWTRWPARSCWRARRATSGSSPTRGSRWPRCWAGWSRPSARNTRPPAASRSTAWPGCSAPSTPGVPRRFPGRRRGGAGHRRAADRPRAGGAGDAGRGPVEPGDRLLSSSSPSTPSRSTSATCWASSARPTAPRPSPGPASWA